MGGVSKIRRFFTFDKIVGYATIVGSIATIYGASKIYNLTVELKPVIKIIQEEQSANQKIIRDTVTIMRRDTVILKKSVSLPPEKDTQPKNLREMELKFRKRHPEIFH